MSTYVYDAKKQRFVEVVGGGTVTLSSIEPIATDRLLGRVSTGTGPVELLTATQIKTLLDILGVTTSNLDAKENSSNKSSSIVTDSASTSKYPHVKSVYDWAIGLFATLSDLSTGLSGKQNALGYTAENAANKNNSTLNNSSTEFPTSAVVKSVTDMLFTLANGKNTAYPFATLSALNAWLAVPANVATLKIGDNLYILDTGTPDYWWDGTQKQELEVSAPNLSGYVPTSRLINGKVLSTNVDLVPSDISGFNAAALAAAPAESAASTSIAGVVILADNTSAITGTNTTKAVTPASLADKLSDWLTNSLNSTFALLTGATFSGAVIFGDQTISRGNQRDMGLIVFDKGTIGATGTVTFDHTQGHKQTLVCGGAFTLTWAFSNWPPTTNLGWFIVKVTNMGLGTLAFASTINWKKKDDTLTTTFSTYLTDRGGETALKSSGFDEFMFWSEDAGSTIYGVLL